MTAVSTEAEARLAGELAAKFEAEKAALRVHFRATLAAELAARDRQAEEDQQTREYEKDQQRKKRRVDAARRHGVDIDTSPPDSDPATSEVDREFEAARERQDNGNFNDYGIFVNWRIYAGSAAKQVIIGSDTPSQQRTRRTFDFDETDVYFVKAVQQHLGDFEDYELKYIATAKSLSSKGYQSRFTLHGFSDTMLEKLLKECDKQYNLCSMPYDVKVSIEGRLVYDKAALKAFQVPATTATEKPSTPLGIEKGRSSKVEQAMLIRSETRALSGDFEAQITRHWRCEDENCTNQGGFCWVEPGRSSAHYPIGTIQQRVWANHCQTGNATVTQPSAIVMDQLKFGTDSAMGKLLTKRSAMKEKEKDENPMKEFMKMQMEMSTQQMQMSVLQQMAEQKERQEDRDERRRQQQLQQQLQQQQQTQYMPYGGYLPPARVPPPPIQYSPLPQYQPPRPATAASYRIHTPTPPLRVSPPTRPVVPAQSSSPIEPDEDGMDTAIRFFDWRIETTANPARKDKWRDARDVTVREDWSIKDLQAIALGTGNLYARALSFGVSDGMARCFTKEIRLFKGVCQQARAEREAAAQALNDLYSTSGGFIPNDEA